MGGALARVGGIKDTQKGLLGKIERKRSAEGHEDGKMWSRYMLLNWGPAVRFCEHGNELLGVPVC